ncbi:MAG: T9SS type A sorting domain-containing protein, partial [Saprospiraceae bacterium]
DVGSINTPYVITFGDGSLAQQSSASQITHAYSQPGVYDVCLSYYVPGTEVGYITCCYPVEILMPQACSCSEDVIYVSSIEPCTWTATMLFALNSQYLPLSVDFGDGTNGVFNSLWITHDFPDPGVYNVCYTYEVFPGDTLECCELVTIPGCCLDPYFELNKVDPPRSCLNPDFRVTHQACTGGIVEATHLWIFSDSSTVYEGPNPPDHLFTNFVNDTGWVCVTHIIICCEDTASYTVCAQHTPGAYLGDPDLELHLSQTLPFTNETVLQFIQQNANGPLPLYIDGTLVADIDAYFEGGTWNMAKDAEILVQGKNQSWFVTFFRMNGTVLQSPARLGLGGCCQWTGIHSELRTYIILDDVTISDADIALHYPANQGLPAKVPILVMRNCLLKNNYFGLKSVNQYISMPSFHGNVFDGAPHPQICSCDAINAFDFTNVNPFLTMKITDQVGSNVIRNYEKGFNLVNTNLQIAGFTMENLRDYNDIPGMPNNPPYSAAVGIDFNWLKQVNSGLEFDDVLFQNFEDLNAASLAVRVQSWGGKHSLTAIANDPHNSIQTLNIAGGYSLSIGPNSTIDGTIAYNDIHTNGGDLYGFGVLGDFRSSKNSLEIDSNLFDINSGSYSLLNAGISLNTETEGHQDFKILDNHLRVALPVGEGIGMTKTNDFFIRRNTIENGSTDIPGIQLDLGKAGVVDCNTVKNKGTGIVVNNSRINRYAANYLRANKRDMEFYGNMMWNHQGSKIKWNRFIGSNLQSLYYFGNARTGKQHHNHYNRWEAQFGVEAYHEGSLSAILACQFWYPYGQAEGTIMHPYATPNELFAHVMGNPPIDTIPDSLFCTSAYDDIVEFQDSIPDPESEWENLLNDTAFWAGLTPAEQTLQNEEIYGMLLENPGWVSGNSTFTNFMNSMTTDFVGQSETLKRDMQQLQSTIEAHQQSLAADRNTLDSLGSIAGTLAEAIASSTDSTEQDSLQALLDPVMAAADSIAASISQTDSMFWLTVLDTVTILKTQNTTLDDSQWHYWAEKRLNEIVLDGMAGTVPDSTATADLRQIAQTCLSDGGRAVLGARGLSKVLLKEYYDDNNCQQPQGRSAVPKPEEVQPVRMQVVPNPANEVVKIRLLNTDPTNVPANVQVVSMRGSVVYSGKIQPGTNELVIPVKGWANGVYLVRVASGATYLTSTFVVQH